MRTFCRICEKKEFWSWRQSILISIANLEGFIFFLPWKRALKNKALLFIKRSIILRKSRQWLYIYTFSYINEGEKRSFFLLLERKGSFKKRIWRHVWMEHLKRTNSDGPKWPTCSINSCARIDPVSIWVSLVMEYRKRRRRRKVIDPYEQRNISSWFPLPITI